MFSPSGASVRGLGKPQSKADMKHTFIPLCKVCVYIARVFIYTTPVLSCEVVFLYKHFHYALSVYYKLTL